MDRELGMFSQFVCCLTNKSVSLDSDRQVKISTSLYASQRIDASNVSDDISL